MPIIIPPELSPALSAVFVKLALKRPEEYDSRICDCDGAALARCMTYWRALEQSGLPATARALLIRGTFREA